MNVLIPLVDGFEEIEAVAVIDILRRARLNVVTAGIPGTMVTGDNGVKLITDKKLDDIDPDGFQAIVLPGGTGYERLGQSSRMMGMLKDFNSKKKTVAAICFSPILLAKAGIMEERRGTVYPGKERHIPRPRPERVVCDGNVITSQGPGTAIEFALKIVECLGGKGKAEKLRKGLVCA